MDILDDVFDDNFTNILNETQTKDNHTYEIYFMDQTLNNQLVILSH